MKAICEISFRRAEANGLAETMESLDASTSNEARKKGRAAEKEKTPMYGKRQIETLLWPTCIFIHIISRLLLSFTKSKCATTWLFGWHVAGHVRRGETWSIRGHVARSIRRYNLLAATGFSKLDTVQRHTSKGWDHLPFFSRDAKYFTRRPRYTSVRWEFNFSIGFGNSHVCITAKVAVGAVGEAIHAEPME